MKRSNSKYNSSSFAFDSSTFSDLTLEICSNNKIVKNIFVSKMYLAIHSHFFMAVFSNWQSSTETTYKINLDSETHIEHFIDVIRSIYDVPLVSKIEDILSVMIVADKYQVEKCINSCVDILTETEFTLENITNYLTLPESIKMYKSVKNSLIYKSTKYINNKFSDVRSLFKSQEFLNVSYEILEVIIQNDLLLVDSENSVLYMVIEWIFKDFAKRNIYFYQLLDNIKFIYMQKYFLLDMVPNIAPYFQDDSASLKKIDYLRIQAIEAQLGGIARLKDQFNASNSVIPSIFTPRRLFEDSNRFIIKCIFYKISEWTPNRKYYSDAVMAHGYEFYFFLKTIQTNGNIAHPPLGAYLRCTSRLMLTKHYLPITSVVSLALRDGTERKFTPSKVIFDSSERAIGGRLTLPDETWENIVSGECPFVINNGITISIMIEFMQDGQGCVKVNNDN